MSAFFIVVLCSVTLVKFAVSQLQAIWITAAAFYFCLRFRCERRPVSHSIFGLCANGFRIVPKSPINRFTNPRCSPSSVSVARLFIASTGDLDFPSANASWTRSAPSERNPVRVLIFAAMLFIASKTA
jgi:hypothetical protein